MDINKILYLLDKNHKFYSLVHNRKVLVIFHNNNDYVHNGHPYNHILISLNQARKMALNNTHIDLHYGYDNTKYEITKDELIKYIRDQFIIQLADI